MLLYKDNIIEKPMFELLAVINSKTVEQMIHNKIVARSESDYDKMDQGVEKWLRENCTGLIYIDDRSNSYRDYYFYYFEKEEEAVAFKLRWQ